MDYANRNLYHKRIFGNDITNVVTKRTSNYSISEKPSQKQIVTDQRLKSRSVSYKPLLQNKDPIVQYEKQIMKHMCSIQKMEQAQIYKFIHQDMRFVLIDWLVEVHQSFDLKEQTLYLALTYLNEFCSKQEVSKHEYQLVGITCLWIASKYEQIYPPKMTNYVDVTDNSYTVKEMKDMEGRIIQSMSFNLTYTTTLNILEAISDKWAKQKNHRKETVLTREGTKNVNMCKYLLELCSIANLNKQYTINTLVLGAITISDSIFKTKSQIKLLDQTQKPDKQTLMKCFKSMCEVLKECHKHKQYNAVIKKFQKQKYCKVAKIKITQK